MIVVGWCCSACASQRQTSKNDGSISQRILPKIIVNGKKTLTQTMVKDANTTYVIKYDYVLASNIIMPPNCTLEFEGGSITGNNYSITGNSTRLQYNKPFLSSVLLKGSFKTEKVPCDSELFKDKKYNTDRIVSMCHVYGPDNRVVFSKNTYNGVETVDISRSVDIDFSGSTVNLKLDKGGLPITFIRTPEREVGDLSFIESFGLRNVIINGNKEYLWDGDLTPATGHRGQAKRRCIQLFKVDEVELENVTLAHFEGGSGGNVHSNPREWYENALIAIQYYNHANINGFVTHDCGADNIIKMSPNVTDDNMAVISNCHSYRNYTGLLMVVDGRCRIFNNVVEDYNSSAFNLFTYDSEIYNNIFINGNRSAAIDLVEVGKDDNDRFSGKNIRIYNNTGDNIKSLCYVGGIDINVYNNVTNNSSSPLVTVWASPLFVGKYLNCKVVKDEKKSIYITNNTTTDGVVFGTIKSDASLVEAGYYIDTLYVAGNYGGYNQYMDSEWPQCIFNVKNCILINNTFKGIGKVRGGTDLSLLNLQINKKDVTTFFPCNIQITNNTFDFDENVPTKPISLLGTYYVAGGFKSDGVIMDVTIEGNIMAQGKKKKIDIFRKQNVSAARISIKDSRNNGF